MLKIKTVCKIGLLLSILFMLTGCWDKEEVEDNAYVIGLGLDKSEKSDKMIKITMLIANPEVGSMQGGGGSTKNQENSSHSMPTIYLQLKAPPMPLSHVI